MHQTTEQRSRGSSLLATHAHREVHILDGLVQVLKPHGHSVLRVVQVAEVGHDDFRTFLEGGGSPRHRSKPRGPLPPTGPE